MAMLDELDLKILSLLQENARLTNKEIAEKVGRTVTPVFERVRKLEQQGYIKKYMAVLDAAKLNIDLLAYTNVRLKEHSQKMISAFEKAILQFPEVMECVHLTGNYDYLLKVAVTDMAAYHSFIVNKLARLPNIGNVQSGFVMKEIKQGHAIPLEVVPNPE